MPVSLNHGRHLDADLTKLGSVEGGIARFGNSLLAVTCMMRMWMPSLGLLTMRTLVLCYAMMQPWKGHHGPTEYESPHRQESQAWHPDAHHYADCPSQQFLPVNVGHITHALRYDSTNC